MESVSRDRAGDGGVSVWFEGFVFGGAADARAKAVEELFQWVGWCEASDGVE